MEPDLHKALIDGEGKLSKSERKLAEFIRANCDRAAFMTASGLAGAVGVSESTVVRFAAHLGYEGYPELREAMNGLNRRRLSSVQRIEMARTYMNGENILKSVLRDDMDKLRRTSEDCDSASFNAAVEKILSAKDVYILGLRTSSCLASFLGFYLNLLRGGVHTVRDIALSEVYEQIMHIGEGDVFIGISYPRYSSRALKAMQFAKSTGAEAIGITDGPSSPLCEAADILLYAGSDMLSFIDSLVAPLSLINALIVAAAARSSGNVADIFRRLEVIWENYEVYETSGR